MIGGLDVRTISFSEPIYLWLLVGPLLLLFLWLWQVLRHRSDTRHYKRDRVVPTREIYAPFGDLTFWLALLLAASFCIVALARPRARVSLVRRSAAADIVI